MSDNNENQIISGWKYYNHAMIPTCEPHEIPNLKPLQSGTLLKNRDVWGGEKTDLYLQGGQRIMIVDMKLPFGIVSKMTFLILAR